LSIKLKEAILRWESTGLIYGHQPMTPKNARSLTDVPLMGDTHVNEGLHVLGSTMQVELSVSLKLLKDLGSRKTTTLGNQSSSRDIALLRHVRRLQQSSVALKVRYAGLVLLAGLGFTTPLCGSHHKGLMLTCTEKCSLDWVVTSSWNQSTQ
jgi:hypothetical protein